MTDSFQWFMAKSREDSCTKIKVKIRIRPLKLHAQFEEDELGDSQKASDSYIEISSKELQEAFEFFDSIDVAKKLEEAKARLKFDEPKQAFETQPDERDEPRLEYFLDSLHPTLCYYAFRFVKDKPTAEDIVGNSFLKILERQDAFVNHRAAKSWLYKTVHNNCIDELRKQNRFKAYEKIQLIEKEGVCNKNALQERIKAEMLGHLHSTLKGLPSQCRTIMEMIYIHDKTIREIANELGLSLSTIKTQKARGLTLLRERLQLDPAELMSMF